MTFIPPSSFPGAARLRRRMLLRRIGVIALLLAILVLVALLWPRPQRGALQVATSDAGSAQGVLRGPLTALRAGDRACFSVPAASGAALLVLPDGWSASSDLNLLDAGGGTAAHPREEVVVTGAPQSAASVPGCPGIGRVWAVASIVPAR